MDVHLVTVRLLLRSFTPGDLELVVALDADPGVKRYIDDDAPVDRDDVADTLDWWCGYPERSPGYGFWAAIERVTGDFVGWFHLRPGTDDARTSPSWAIDCIAGSGAGASRRRARVP